MHESCTCRTLLREKPIKEYSTLAPEKRGEGPEDPPEGNPTAKIQTVSTSYFRFLRVLNRQAASILSIKGDLGKFFDREST